VWLQPTPCWLSHAAAFSGISLLSILFPLFLGRIPLFSSPGVHFYLFITDEHSDSFSRLASEVRRRHVDMDYDGFSHADKTGRLCSVSLTDER
jgi:hypothetical protein